MSDVIQGGLPGSVPPTTTPPAPVVPASPPTPSAGGIVGGNPPAPPVPPTYTPPATPQYDPADEVIVGDKKYTFDQLLQAQAELDKVRASGYDIYEKALKGDASAIQSLMGKGTEPTQTPATPPQPSIDPNEWGEVKSYISQLRADQTRQAIQTVLTRPEYQALSQRPDAVDFSLNAIRMAWDPNTKLTESLVHHILKDLNQREAAYQDKLVAPYKSQAGDLGVSEPFRGGPPQVTITERPDPIRDPNGYKKYLAERVKIAAYQDAQKLGQAG